jgi:hypothetical protein
MYEITTAIFLLMFSVLACAWFYLQRAKARDAQNADASVEPTAPATEAVAEPIPMVAAQPTDRAA